MGVSPPDPGEARHEYSPYAFALPPLRRATIPAQNCGGLQPGQLYVRGICRSRAPSCRGFTSGRSPARRPRRFPQHQLPPLAGGAVLLPLNIRLTPNELAYILNDAGATILFVEKQF